MSIFIMSRVWKHSQASGSALLVLLAIADHADDDGIAYPSVSRLAKKSRISERNTQYALQYLISLGELQVERNAGPLRTNLYRVVTDPVCRANLPETQENPQEGENFAPPQDLHPQEVVGNTEVQDLHPEGVVQGAGCSPEQGAAQRQIEGAKLMGVQPVAPESSVFVVEAFSSKPSVIQPSRAREENDGRARENGDLSIKGETETNEEAKEAELMRLWKEMHP